ncbi:MAG: HdaA/DnaA family protein [Hyphomicrobiaceae bacterium]
MSQPHQLVFDLPHLEAFEAEDFLVSQCNQSAVDMIDSWPDWPAHAVVVCGAAGSGKSHLVSVWRERSGGDVVSMTDVTAATISRFQETGRLAIEDVAAGGDPETERLVFHLLNAARERKNQILITTRQPPGELEIALPDLRSRLRALPIAQIQPIDDALLSGLLVKLFSDRQLAIDPGVIKYLMRHMERSAQSAREVVERIDRLALATHRKVTRALAAEALR